MNASVLNRFDLIFVLKDNPNRSHDHLLSDHIMNVKINSKELDAF